jgi:hypothetical protein
MTNLRLNDPKTQKRKMHLLSFAIQCALVGTSSSVLAATFSVTNTNDAGAGSLRQAILDANASGSPAGIVTGTNIVNITPSGTITLNSPLPLVFSNLTLNGNGNVVDGGSAHRCFFISGLPTTATGSPQAISVTLQNLQLNHCRAKGGDGGNGMVSGGGGLGAGGAVFVNSNATLALSKVTFSSNAAVGGNGGATGADQAGGGGGMGGNGHDGGGGLGGEGGVGQYAGGGGIGGPGGAGTAGGGGGGGFGESGIGQISAAQGFGPASNGDQGITGGNNGGGGGGGGIGGTSGDSGAQTGFGGIGGNGGTGGLGGFNSGVGGGGGGAPGFSATNGGFGGGGGSSDGFGGNGGFGGGGGRSSTSNVTGESGGTGGLGGGGGGGYFAGASLFGGGAGAGYDSSGVFGGGKGGYTFGGGGGAMGGSVFVVDGGHVTISGSTSMSGGMLTAGSAGGSDGRAQPGTAHGNGVFLQGNGVLNFELDNAATYALIDGISDVQGAGGGAGSGSWGLTLGSGTLALTSTTFLTGNTTISGGTLELDENMPSTFTVEPNGTLSGIGTAANVLNNGTVLPGNGSSSVCGMPSNYQLSAAAFSQSSSGILHIVADPCDGNRQLVINGPAGLGGTLYMDFTGGPTVGETFTVMTATTINGSFADYQTNMKSVFGQIIYMPQSIQFKVIANDVIFINGFD